LIGQEQDDLPSRVVIPQGDAKPYPRKGTRSVVIYPKYNRSGALSALYGWSRAGMPVANLAYYKKKLLRPPLYRDSAILSKKDFGTLNLMVETVNDDQGQFVRGGGA